MTTKLALRHEPGGWRHYLAGKPIHCGDQIQMRIGGSWIWVRYEATNLQHPDDPAVALYALGGTILYDSEADFRWEGKLGRDGQ
jgi:hypothetical protein